LLLTAAPTAIPAPNDNSPINTAVPVLTPDFSCVVELLLLDVVAGAGLLVVVVVVVAPLGEVVVVVVL
jgi:hypothetical protein